MIRPGSKHQGASEAHATLIRLLEESSADYRHLLPWIRGLLVPAK